MLGAKKFNIDKRERNANCWGKIHIFIVNSMVLGVSEPLTALKKFLALCTAIRKD